MNSKMVMAALLLASTLANAATKGKVEATETKGTTAKTATEAQSNKAADLNSRLLDSVKEVSKSKTGLSVRSDIDLVDAARKEISNIQDKNIRDMMLNEIDYIASLTSSKKALATFAKLVDLASRKDVGANNKVYQQTMKDLAKALRDVQAEMASNKIARDTDLLAEALKRALKEKEELIENCV